MHSIIRFLAFVLLVSLSDGVNCPHYCRCLVSNGLRHVQCIGKGLISVELDVPRTVQWLQLSNNSIYELRDNIFEDLGLEHIITLNLDNNAIQSVGLNAFSGLSQLRFLDLSKNHLYHLPPGIFENNPTLHYLLLSGNPLRYISGHQPFVISHSVSVLDISNCRLNYIPKSAFIFLPSLVKLNISLNHIGYLDLLTFENMTKLTEIDLNQNKLSCDPATQEVMSWLESKKIKTLGSPCYHVSSLTLPSGPMMERMMVLPNTISEESEFDDYDMSESNDCICPNVKNDETKQKESISDEDVVRVRDDRKSTLKNNNPLFLILAFTNGLIVGIAVSLSFWVCSRWMKARKARRNINNYSAINYDGPPPAYSDLF